jgi:putative peptidoglycan lipid II flippase
MIIAGVFVLSVTNVIFPKLSRLSAGNESAAFKDTLGKTVRTSLYIVVPMAAGLMALSRPIIDLVYGGGQFTTFSVDITASSLRYVSLGMLGYAVQSILSRAYFAQQDGRAPLLAGALSIAVNLALSALLTGPLGVVGLALASAAAATVNAVILMLPLEARRAGFVSRVFLIDFIKILVSAAAMAGAAYGLAAVLGGVVSGTLGKLVTAGVPAAAGAAVYFILTALLRVTEAKSAIGAVLRIVKRGKVG